MRRSNRFLLLLACLCSSLAAAATFTERPEWGRYFEAEGTVGTFVLCDAHDACEVYDRARAERPLPPASTFKIANALIALDTGAVKDIHERFAWDGVTREYPQWNRDHDLASAMAASAVPVYQEVARRIGAERMERYLRLLGYGNADIGGGIDRFWLDGALRISAVGQIEFLRKLQAGTLPVSARSQALVREITTVENTPDYQLHAKSGLFSAGTPRLGWWVGWVERAGEPHFFALNIDVTRPEHVAARLSIARAILAERRVGR